MRGEGRTGDRALSGEFLSAIGYERVVITTDKRENVNSQTLGLLNEQDMDIFITGEDGAVRIMEGERGFEIKNE